ncbi:polysaccharide deacetylase family protein [Tianweitania sp. BSSL-BM11]|uniref:Chitooligosaccharide deacetylase n=1 Tax=Tianweitania aestuarii TaxID=2814886 RepID=A0ABS5RU42_9HYPH|nr:polysaccharide deacetylase family protein [Tianweitania aestuarii]MBS9719806.1 polysaccharide deacetylase family protein [Tianweitania aestuarii]
MRFSLSAFAVLISLSAASAEPLVEPSLHLPHSGHLRVAVTLDACGGKTDARILDTLVANHIPATIFATGRWLKHNGAALAVLKAHPDLFEIEDHGANHIPAVDHASTIYGLKAAGSPAAVEAEVQGGADALIAAGVPHPHWFRGATAKYSRGAISEVHALGLKVAGYSLNGDGGSLLGAKQAQKVIAAAKDGDVIIAHINQPTHQAGSGVAAGLLALKARGAEFVKLDGLKSDETGQPAAQAAF